MNVNATGDIDTAVLWESVEQGVLPLRQCRDCTKTFVLPLPSCPHCAATDPEVISARGTGSLYSWTVTHHPFDPEFGDDTPYIVGAVTLDEGARVLGRVRNVAQTELRDGLRLRLHAGLDGQPPLVFEQERTQSPR